MVYIEIVETYEDGRLKRVTKMVSDDATAELSPSPQTVVSPWFLQIGSVLVIAILGWLDLNSVSIVFCANLLLLFLVWCNQKFGK